MKKRLSWLFSNGSVAFTSLYGCGVRSHMIVISPISATNACSTMMKMTASRKPIESYKRPLTDGPTNAPRANVDVQSPDTNPYVSMLSGNPCRLWEKTRNRNLYLILFPGSHFAQYIHCRPECICETGHQNCGNAQAMAHQAKYNRTQFPTKACFEFRGIHLDLNFIYIIE